MMARVKCRYFYSMSKLGIERENPAVCFAQLLGMSDHISYLLGMELSSEHCLHDC